MKKLSRQFRHCKHNFVDTNIFKNPDQFGKFCSKCGTPERYPKGFSYKYSLSLITKGFLTAWRELPNAFKIIDLKSLWIFVNSFFSRYFYYICYFNFAIFIFSIPIIRLIHVLFKKKMVEKNSVKFHS